MSTQPEWKLIANLGDASLDYGNIDYGGYLVYVDETGAYPPEGEFIVEPADYQWSSDGWDNGARWTVYRFALERCTYIDGVLSDNPYHPELPAWFADNLPRVAETIGSEPKAIISALCSDDPRERAQGWREIGEYHGFENLDGYPETLTEQEAKERYGK